MLAATERKAYTAMKKKLLKEDIIKKKRLDPEPGK